MLVYITLRSAPRYVIITAKREERQRERERERERGRAWCSIRDGVLPLPPVLPDHGTSVMILPF
jgi:hypothetical protein